MQQPFGAATAATLIVVLFALVFLEAVDFFDREVDEALRLFLTVPPLRLI
jgi:hypothetical protein